MTGETTAVVKVLVDRGQQRGFLLVGEIQQELEEAGSPTESFEVVFTELIDGVAPSDHYGVLTRIRY